MAKKRATTKVRKKMWVPIHAPRQFNEQLVGETTVYEVQDCLGKDITINMMALTRDMKKQHVNVSFKVNTVKNSMAYTEFTGYKLAPAFLKRLIRRNRNKVTDSFIVITKDKKNVRVKPLLITRGLAPRSTLTQLKSEMHKQISIYAKKNDFDNIANDVIMNKMQRTMKGTLQKIFPVKSLEIRNMKIEKTSEQIKEEQAEQIAKSA